MKLSIEQAIENIDRVCRVFKGSRDEHEALKISIELIKSAIKEGKCQKK